MIFQKKMLESLNVLIRFNKKNERFISWIHKKIGFSLIVSLYVIYNLNSFVVFFGTIFGSLLVYFLSNFPGSPPKQIQ